MKKLLKFLFSRYALSAVFIVAELALLGYLLFYGYAYSSVFVVIAGIVDVLVIISLINRNTNPEFKLTWLAVVALLPIFGGALYIIFSRRRITKRESRLLAVIGRGMTMAGGEELGEDYTATLENLNDLAVKSESVAGRALSILKDDSLAALYKDCEAIYYDSGEEFFNALVERLKTAEKYIFLEYFIIENGLLWQRIYSVLNEKTKCGVEVRILYDDIGSMNTLPSGFAKKMRSEGILCHRFAKVDGRLTSSHNNRDHRKICVVDGEYAFTGGANIADEYINKKNRFGHWKDGGIEVRGDVARGFARQFLLLYDFTVGKVSDYDKFLSRPKVTEPEENNSPGGYMIPFGSGPSPAYSEPVGKNIFMNIIDMANRYIYITTPYLIIDYDLTEALRSAARRGVDVRIITPYVADKKIIKIMTKGSYPYLLQSGVRIFEYTPGFIHEKLIVADDVVAVSGTVNFDYRSLVHHFEDGLWLFDHPEIINMRSSFLEAEKKSHEILKEDAKLGPFEKLIKDLVRIFAPLL